ncbi:pyridoxal phosphate-dependent aminotransferase [Octadecabacter sp. R77987]|uniref:pyridoxal phosphate-dependent aminotransferase n=1 Tax=Octadecabacter sp. R77987 TaxID=3093874 RepID=UPI00366F0D92
MKLSQRIQDITGGGSGGWDLYFRARALKEAGAPIIELTVGEHDIRTSADILDAMHEAARSGHTGYAAIPGTRDLREAVAARITAQSGVPTTARNVTITPGGQSALFASHNAMLDAGDTGLFIDPYYATYPGTIRAVGGIPQTVPAEAARGFQPRGADIDTAAKATHAKSLLINSPNNPTGAVYTADTLQEIARATIDNDMWLISDEVYDSQIWEGAHISPRALPDMAQRTLVVGSMSKSHAMTGSRVGWVCGPEDVIDYLITLSTHTTYGVPGYIQDAATFALGQGASVEEQVAAPFRRRRLLTRDLLAKQNVVHAAPIQGAMYVMLDIRATGMSGEDFGNALLDGEQIAVMPGESFGAAAAGHIRVAMTVDDDVFVDAMTRLIGFAATLATGETA